MSNRILGTLALIGAPFLFIGTYMEESVPSLRDSWFTGVWGILYITGWMCSILVLQRMNATGKGKFGKTLIAIIVITLAIANISNVIQLVVEQDKPDYFFYIDLGWPLSNVLMLILGITIMIKRSLPGNTRWIPLACGLWLPLVMVFLKFMGKTELGLILGGIYPTIFWSLMALMVRRVPDTESDVQLLDSTVSII